MNKIISLAPGRVCLFGDHQDYLGLPVVACAINRNIKLTAVKNSKKVFNINMIDINETRTIDINEVFENLKPRDYFASSLRVLRRYKCIPTSGYDIIISGNIPINSGTSSSTALLMAWIQFLVKAFGVGIEVTPEIISKIGHEAEVLEHGEPGGMMDHYTIGVGNIVHITTTFPYTCKQIGTEITGLITGVSGVPKETIGLIADLKGNVFNAIEILKNKFKNFDLNSLEVKDLKRYNSYLPNNLIPYFEAAIKNHYYTKQALLEFEKPILNLEKVGTLMNGHHAVLRDLLKITVPKIDNMIDAALSAGAYGAKIVGSGGGGSIVVIAEPGRESFIIEALLQAGSKEAYKVSVDKGVRILKSN